HPGDDEEPGMSVGWNAPTHPDFDARELVRKTVVVDAEDLGNQFFSVAETLDFETFDLRPALTNALFTIHIDEDSVRAKLPRSGLEAETRLELLAYIGGSFTA